MRPPGTAHHDAAALPLRGVHLSFQPSFSMSEVTDTLELARLAAESLHGPERVELDGRFDVDSRARTVVIDTTTDVGRTLAIVFLGYVKREFGADAVRVLRMGNIGTGVTR